MADFCQFLMCFSWNSLILGKRISRVGWEGHGDMVGGGKSLNKEVRCHNNQV